MPTDWKWVTIFVGVTFALLLGGGMALNAALNPSAPGTTTDGTSANTPDNATTITIEDYMNATATISTDKGDITFELLTANASQTTSNFIQLAEEGYYNGLTFHRVIDGFMIQGGDPTGTGSGGESAFGGSFADEINAESLGLNDMLVSTAPFLQGMYSPDDLAASADKSVKEFYEQQGYSYRTDIESVPMEPGAVAMANSGPDTNGSQFFIVTDSAQPHLDGKHTVFGRVIEGLDVAREIEQNDVMNTVTITQAEAESPADTTTEAPTE